MLRVLMRMALPVVLAASLLGATVATASAGSNGQQIRFTCNQMTDAVVNGTNQAGNTAQWRGSPSVFNGERYVFTSGWYWVGFARIHWWTPQEGRWRSIDIQVPRSQTGDVVNARC